MASNNSPDLVPRGSRKHVLDWTDQKGFLNDLRAMLPAIDLDIPASTHFMPVGRAAPKEARLETFGLEWQPELSAWAELRNWWLCHKRGANTPNWDIALGCGIEGRPGLILVEAKANEPELSPAGKPADKNASANSQKNHERIGEAIEEACVGWREIHAEVSISRDSHYQLANRLAFTWKLATLGIPVVLMYLGFTGDEGIRNVGEPFADDADWRRIFKAYIEGTFPGELLERRLDIAGVPVWVVSRSRVIVDVSPPPGTKT